MYIYQLYPLSSSLPESTEEEEEDVAFSGRLSAIFILFLFKEASHCFAIARLNFFFFFFFFLLLLLMILPFKEEGGGGDEGGGGGRITSGLGEFKEKNPKSSKLFEDKSDLNVKRRELEA